MGEISKAKYHGFDLEAYRALDPNQPGMRGWYSRVRNREGDQINDEVRAPWITRSEAEDRTVEIVKLEIAKLGETEPTELPVWQTSN